MFKVFINNCQHIHVRYISDDYNFEDINQSKFSFDFYVVVKRFMITKNPIVKIQILVLKHESRPIKSYPAQVFSIAKFLILVILQILSTLDISHQCESVTHSLLHKMIVTRNVKQNCMKKTCLSSPCAVLGSLKRKHSKFKERMTTQCQPNHQMPLDLSGCFLPMQLFKLLLYVVKKSRNNDWRPFFYSCSTITYVKKIQ